MATASSLACGCWLAYLNSHMSSNSRGESLWPPLIPPKTNGTRLDATVVVAAEYLALGLWSGLINGCTSRQLTCSWRQQQR